VESSNSNTKDMAFNQVSSIKKSLLNLGHALLIIEYSIYCKAIWTGRNWLADIEWLWLWVYINPFYQIFTSGYVYFFLAQEWPSESKTFIQILEKYYKRLTRLKRQ
jgi:hypothetical protein